MLSSHTAKRRGLFKQFWLFFSHFLQKHKIPNQHYSSFTALQKPNNNSHFIAVNSDCLFALLLDRLPFYECSNKLGKARMKAFKLSSLLVECFNDGFIYTRGAKMKSRMWNECIHFTLYSLYESEFQILLLKRALTLLSMFPFSIFPIKRLFRHAQYNIHISSALHLLRNMQQHEIQDICILFAQSQVTVSKFSRLPLFRRRREWTWLKY